MQGTLREALDAGMLVNKSSGLHDIPIVLSLAHNVACAMAYLHQVGGTAERHTARVVCLKKRGFGGLPFMRS
jgi:hypothetical protein